MKYIKREPVVVDKLVCSHPAVKMVWDYGGLSANPTDEARYFVSILFKNGERKDFSGGIDSDVISEAENYLQQMTADEVA